MPTDSEPQFTAVTITFKMTPGQRADWAREYGLDPSESFDDLTSQLERIIPDALSRNYMVREFTSYSVAGPA